MLYLINKAQMKKLFLLFTLVSFLTSCNVTESIVFNKDMSGEYISSFDLSPMMNYANANRPPSQEGSKKEKMDTTIVFNDLFKTHKDSIASLSDEQRARLEKLRGMVVDVHMDEENSVFEFNMVKSFKSFKDLESINDQIDEAMGIVKGIGNKNGQAPEGQLDELTKTDKVIYSFEGNTFSRFQPNSVLNEDEDEDSDVEMDEDSKEEDDNDFAQQFEMQFEEIFSTSFYTLIYKFPRKVKSVSNENAVISEDGKTVTYKVPWNTIQKDDKLMNLNVVLED